MNVKNFKKDKSKDKIITVIKKSHIAVPFINKCNTDNQDIYQQRRAINHLCRSCSNMLVLVINKKIQSATCRTFEVDCREILTYKCEKYID